MSSQVDFKLPPFRLLSTGFTVSWDINELEKSFIEPNVDDNPTKDGYQHSIADPLGRPHWQNFAQQFSQNFYYFRDECNEVAEKLKKLQYDLRDSTDTYIRTFLEHNVEPWRVRVLRLRSGGDMAVHVDKRRDICINIGLRNSSYGITHISDNISVKNYWNSNRTSYRMNDGDVYLLDVKMAHHVESLIPDNSSITRDIISYIMIERDIL